MIAPAAPLAEEKRAWQAFAVASASIFMFVLDAGLLTVSLPEIERAFPNSSRATISWVSTGYLVMLAGLMLVSGRLGDIYGRRRVFRIGLVVLGCGSLAAGLANSIGLLIVARMVQGSGGALVTATALALVLSDLPVERQPFAIGIWGSVGSTAAVLGPTLGAEVVDLLGWRYAVALIAPISFITYAASHRVLREVSDPDAATRLDPLGVVLATAGVGGVALGLSQTRVWGWSDIRTVGAIMLGLAAVVGFLVRGAGHDRPLVSLRLFENRPFTGATTAAFVQQLGFLSWFFSTSFVLREIWGWSVRETGQALSISFVFAAITGWIGGRAAERYGYFWPTTIGAVVTTLGPVYWFFAFEAEPSFWAVYLPGAALFGLGGGTSGVLTTGMALRTTSAADQGMAYATHQTVRRVSASIGLALMAALLGEASGAALLGGARNVWLLVAAAHLVMIVPIWPERRTRPSPAS